MQLSATNGVVPKLEPAILLRSTKKEIWPTVNVPLERSPATSLSYDVSFLGCGLGFSVLLWVTAEITVTNGGVQDVYEASGGTGS
jgi:hypothetical protein